MERNELERLAEQIVAAGIARVPDEAAHGAYEDAPVHLLNGFIDGGLEGYVTWAFDDPSPSGIDAAATCFAENVNTLRRRFGLSREEAIQHQAAGVRAIVEDLLTPATPRSPER